MNSLSAGNYRLTLKTKAGFASIGLTAANPAPVPETQPQVQPGSPSNAGGNAAQNAQAKPGVRSSALTGDTTGITNYVMIGGIALMLLIAGLLIRRKCRV